MNTYLKVVPIAEMVSEYRKVMDKTFLFTAKCLGEKCRLLAEFSGTVLAERETEYDMKFTIWDWSYDKTGLYQEDYYMNEYISAKEEFCRRILKCACIHGLVSENRYLAVHG